jgi:hypothetical protein
MLACALYYVQTEFPRLLADIMSCMTTRGAPSVLTSCCCRGRRVRNARRSIFLTAKPLRRRSGGRRTTRALLTTSPFLAASSSGSVSAGGACCERDARNRSRSLSRKRRLTCLASSLVYYHSPDRFLQVTLIRLLISLHTIVTRFLPIQG